MRALSVGCTMFASASCVSSPFRRCLHCPGEFFWRHHIAPPWLAFFHHGKQVAHLRGLFVDDLFRYAPPALEWLPITLRSPSPAAFFGRCAGVFVVTPPPPKTDAMDVWRTVGLCVVFRRGRSPIRYSCLSHAGLLILFRAPPPDPHDSSA